MLNFVRRGHWRDISGSKGLGSWFQYTHSAGSCKACGLSRACFPRGPDPVAQVATGGPCLTGSSCSPWLLQMIVARGLPALPIMVSFIAGVPLALASLAAFPELGYNVGSACMWLLQWTTVSSPKQPAAYPGTITPHWFFRAVPPVRQLW